jgi:hypothetical protein
MVNPSWPGLTAVFRKVESFVVLIVSIWGYN